MSPRVLDETGEYKEKVSLSLAPINLRYLDKKCEESGMKRSTYINKMLETERIKEELMKKF